MPATTRSQSKAKASADIPSISEKAVSADDVTPDAESTGSHSDYPSLSESRVKTRRYCGPDHLRGCSCFSDSDSDFDVEDEDEDSYWEQPPTKYEWYNYPVDLVTVEKLRNNIPIYTRSLLQDIRAQQQEALHQINLPSVPIRTEYLTWRDPNGRLTKIWEKKNCGRIERNPIEHVRVDFMPRIFLDRDFQRECGWKSEAVFWLRVDNNTITEPVGGFFYDAPYALTPIYPEKDSDLDYAGEMKRCRDAIAQSLAYWGTSDLRGSFINTIKDAVSSATQIEKILCFGLGALRPYWAYNTYNSTFQHISVFCIANILAERYKKGAEKGRKIQILLQNPHYLEKDWILFKELHTAMGCEASSEIEFVRDPDGLLAIDSHTMVIAPNLPVAYPWAQIIADLFASGSGPAIIMGDHLAADQEQKIFKIQDRGSPAVARFLSDRYVQTQTGLEGEGPREKLPAKMFHLPRKVDWLPDMNIFVRKEGM